MAQGQIIAFRRDRLGARLRSLISGLRLQATTGADLRVLWPVGHYSRDLRRPQDLFQRPFVRRNLVLDDGEIDKALAQARPVETFSEFDALQQHLSDGGHVVIENLGETVAFPWEDAAVAARDFIASAHAIPLNATVMERLDLFDAYVDGREAHALHVRRGDIIYDPRWAKSYWPTKYVPDEYYDVMIDAQPRAAHILFSDTPATIDRFRETHGILSATAIMELDSERVGRSDLCELLALAQCKSVLAGSYSAFSTAAAMIGGAQKVALPDDMPDQLRMRAEDRLMQRVRKGPAAFLNTDDYGQCAHRVVDCLDARGAPTYAAAVRTAATTGGIWIPHLGGPVMQSAAEIGDDQSMLDMLRNGEKYSGFLRSHIKKPARMKAHMRRLASAARAYAGLADTPRAVQALFQAALLQDKPRPLDLLTARLKTPLATGLADCPPTTLLRYDATTPWLGTAPLATEDEALVDRFLDNEPPYHWQTAFFLDWKSLRPLVEMRPDPEALTRLCTAGETGTALEKSIAALAYLFRKNRAQARRLIAEAAKSADDLTGVDAALLAKRQAHVALAHNTFGIAAGHMANAFEQSAHPAFVTWWAQVEHRRGKSKKALDRLAHISNPPVYARYLQLKIIEATGSATPEARKQMQAEFEAAYSVTQLEEMAHA